MNTDKLQALQEVLVQLAPIQFLAAETAHQSHNPELVVHCSKLMQQRLIALNAHIVKELLQVLPELANQQPNALITK